MSKKSIDNTKKILENIGIKNAKVSLNLSPKKLADIAINIPIAIKCGLNFLIIFIF